MLAIVQCHYCYFLLSTIRQYLFFIYLAWSCSSSLSFVVLYIFPFVSLICWDGEVNCIMSLSWVWRIELTSLAILSLLFQDLFHFPGVGNSSEHRRALTIKYGLSGSSSSHPGILVVFSVKVVSSKQALKERERDLRRLVFSVINGYISLLLTFMSNICRFVFSLYSTLLIGDAFNVLFFHIFKSP